LGEVNGVTIVDDYAPHPAEIEVTLKAAAKMGYNAVWAVFQPFTYSRTERLLGEFASALAIADHVVLSEIMGGREQNTSGIRTAGLAAKIPQSVWFEGFREIADYVLANAKPGDLVITMGCGDVYKCAKMMVGRG
jgi:UDP-N-acetylmuramate--alanine ligase